MHSPIIAVLAAGLAGWIFGAVWYGVLGKPWQRALGLNPDDCKGKKMPLAPMVTSFIVALVMSAVLYPVLLSAGARSVVPAAVTGLISGVGSPVVVLAQPDDPGLFGQIRVVGVEAVARGFRVDVVHGVQFGGLLGGVGLRCLRVGDLPELVVEGSGVCRVDCHGSSSRTGTSALLMCVRVPSFEA